MEVKAHDYNACAAFTMKIINKALIMNTNLTKNVIAICSAISFSLLSSFAISETNKKSSAEEWLKNQTNLCVFDKNAKSCFDLGMLNLPKVDTGSNSYELAKKFLHMSCEMNHHEGCFNLALLYERNNIKSITDDGTDISFLIASDLYEKACKGEFIKACAQRIQLSVKTEDSCKSGQAQSCLSLGVVSETGKARGTKGRPDYKMAYSYYFTACNGGIEKACDLALRAKNKVKNPSKSGHQVEQGVGSIESPDGLYQVTPNAVYQIKVTEKNSYGQYKFNSYIIEKAGKYSNDYKNTKFSKHYKVGDHAAKGLWSPNAQQFYISSFEVIPKAPQCNQWTDPEWTFSYIPTTIELNGRKVSAWKDTDHLKPDKRTCDWVKIDKKTCKIECTKWREAFPSSYLFNIKEDAIAYLRYRISQPTPATSHTRPTKPSGSNKHGTAQSKPNKISQPNEHQIKRSQRISEHLKKQAERKKAKQKQAEELAKARAKEKARQAALKEEQRLENERKEAARKAAQKKNEEYSAAIQALVKERAEKLKELEIKYKEIAGVPYQNRTQAQSRKELKAQALANAEARKSMSREEQRAARLEYAKARKKVEMEYREAKAKLEK